MTTKYGGAKLLLACGSFLAFAGFAASVAGRAPADEVAAPPPSSPYIDRILRMERPAPTAVPTPERRQQPVARTRGT